MKIYNGDAQDVSNMKSESFMQLNSCGIRLGNNNDSICFRTKGRIDYHLIYITNGQCEVEYDKKKDTISRGDFVIYPPGMPQRYIDFKDTNRIWLHFTGHNVGEIMNEAKLEYGIHHSCYMLSIEKLLVQLVAEHSHCLKVSNEKGMLVSLLYNLGKLINNNENSNDSLGDCISYIVTHYNNTITIEEMAKACSMSRSRFMAVFKERTGLSPHAYQQRLRIDNSRTMLSATKLSISDIGRMSGYDDPLYFSRIFRKITGFSPSEYREHYTMS